MFPSYTPKNHQRFYVVFRRYNMGTFARNGLITDFLKDIKIFVCNKKNVLKTNECYINLQKYYRNIS